MHYAVSKKNPNAWLWEETVRKCIFIHVWSTVVALKLILSLNPDWNASLLNYIARSVSTLPSAILFLTLHGAVPSLTCWWSCSRTKRRQPVPLVRSPGREAGLASASNLTRAGTKAAKSTRRPSAARLIMSPVFCVFRLMLSHVCTLSVDICRS